MHFESYIDPIRQCPLFDHIATEDLTQMLTCIGARVVSYAPKIYIRDEEDIIEDVGVILLGHIDMVSEDIYGHRTTLVRMGPRELFGESFALSDSKRSTVSFLSIEPCTVLYIPLQRVLHICSNSCPFHHRLIQNMFYTLSLKNQQLIEKSAIVSKPTLQDKIWTYLNLEAEHQQKTYFDIPLNRNELADYLCANRSALTRELKHMKEKGLIDFDKNTFHLIKERKQ